MKPVAKQEFWNLPNTLTVARCAAVPVVVVFMMFPGPAWCSLACALFVAASLTDLLDGYLARKLNLTSTIGAFLDPLADKLLVMAAMVMLLVHDRLPGWVVVIMLSREITITALRAIAASEGIVIAARSLGKYKAVFQVTSIAFLIWHYDAYGVNAHSVGIVLMGFALVYALLSAYDYLSGFVRATVVA